MNRCFCNTQVVTGQLTELEKSKNEYLRKNDEQVCTEAVLVLFCILADRPILFVNLLLIDYGSDHRKIIDCLPVSFQCKTVEKFLSQIEDLKNEIRSLELVNASMVSSQEGLATKEHRILRRHHSRYKVSHLLNFFLCFNDVPNILFTVNIRMIYRTDLLSKQLKLFGLFEENCFICQHFGTIETCKFTIWICNASTSLCLTCHDNTSPLTIWTVKPSHWFKRPVRFVRFISHICRNKLRIEQVKLSQFYFCFVVLRRANE